MQKWTKNRQPQCGRACWQVAHETQFRESFSCNPLEIEDYFHKHKATHECRASSLQCICYGDKLIQFNARELCLHSLMSEFCVLCVYVCGCCTLSEGVNCQNGSSPLYMKDKLLKNVQLCLSILEPSCQEPFSIVAVLRGGNMAKTNTKLYSLQGQYTIWEHCSLSRFHIWGSGSIPRGMTFL